MRSSMAGCDVASASSGELAAMARTVCAELASRTAPESPAACMELVEELSAVTDSCEAAISGMVARADTSGEMLACGYPSATAWLATSCGMRYGRAKERLICARQLPRLPATAKRFSCGDLSYGYVAAVCQAVAPLDDEDAAVAEQILLGLADAGEPVRMIDRAGARMNDLIDTANGTEKPDPDSRRGFRQPWLQISGALDGGAFLRGYADAELKQLLLDALAPLAKPQGEDDDRDQHQRTADALKTLLAGGGRNWTSTLVINLASPAGTQDGGTSGGGSSGTSSSDNGSPSGTSPRGGPGSRSRSTRSGGSSGNRSPDGTSGGIRSDGSPDSGHPGGLPDDVPIGGLSDGSPDDVPPAGLPAGSSGGNDCPGGPLPDGSPPGESSPGRSSPGSSWPGDPLGGILSARLLDGTPIPVWRARQIAMNSGISTLLLGPSGHPLYLGRTTRLGSPAQRRVLEVLYPTCAVTGCGIPGRWCEVDHIPAWHPAGATDIDKLALTCGFHNRYKVNYPERVTTSRDQHRRWHITINHHTRRTRPKQAAGPAP